MDEEATGQTHCDRLDNQKRKIDQTNAAAISWSLHPRPKSCAPSLECSAIKYNDVADARAGAISVHINDDEPVIS